MIYEVKTKKEIFAYEETQGGVLKDSIENLGILKNPHKDFTTMDRTKVYIFRRTNDDFDPQLHVWYHFDITTERIKGIRYNWGLSNPRFNSSKEKEKLEKLIKREKDFISKYTLLKEEIEEKFDKPIKSKTLADTKTSFIENVFWENNEIIIGLTIRFDRELIKIPGAGIVSDFKIEKMVTFK